MNLQNLRIQLFGNSTVVDECKVAIAPNYMWRITLIGSIDLYRLHIDILLYSRNIVIDAETVPRACIDQSVKVRSIEYRICFKQGIN